MAREDEEKKVEVMEKTLEKKKIAKIKDFEVVYEKKLRKEVKGKLLKKENDDRTTGKVN